MEIVQRCNIWPGTEMILKVAFNHSNSEVHIRQGKKLRLIHLRWREMALTPNDCMVVA